MYLYWLIAVAGLVFASLLFAFIWLFSRLVRRERLSAFSVDQLTVFSTAKYRPLERLLDDDDVQFLQSQPGYTPEIGRVFRRQRRRVFRGYLGCLKRDFGRLYLAAKLVVLYSSVDRLDLVKTLAVARFRFAVGMLRVEWRLACHQLGLGEVDVRALVDSLDALHAQVRQLIALAPAPQAA